MSRVCGLCGRKKSKLRSLTMKSRFGWKDEQPVGESIEILASAASARSAACPPFTSPHSLRPFVLSPHKKGFALPRRIGCRRGRPAGLCIWVPAARASRAAGLWLREDAAPYRPDSAASWKRNWGDARAAATDGIDRRCPPCGERIGRGWR